MIKGLEKLNKKQIQELFRCNNEQKDCICDREQKRGYEIIETWVDENDVVCARLRNGNWYHYKDGTWY